MKLHGIVVTNNKPVVTNKIYKNDSGVLEIAKVYKFQPCTKHINTKLYHFYHYVEQVRIRINIIDTTNQQTDYLTELVSERVLVHLC